MMREWREAESREERQLLALFYLVALIGLALLATIVWERGGIMPEWPPELVRKR